MDTDNTDLTDAPPVLSVLSVQSVSIQFQATLDHYKNDQNRFAIIPIDDYLFLKALLNDEEKLADYLDYLHMQTVKAESGTSVSLADVKRELSLD